jgi:glycosyltransferase involved in cell wall biosynthesis
MKVAVDAQLAVGTGTGIGEYVTGMMAALRAAGVEIAPLAMPRLDPWRFDRRVLWDQIGLPVSALRSGADLLHCASGTMPLWSPLPVVTTVHDVAWLRVQRHARCYARLYFGRFALARYRRARRLIADSHFSAAELRALVGERLPISVVYPGVADDLAALRREDGDGRTILAVGTVEPRKNLELLVRVLPPLPEVRLIAVGPLTPYARRCRELARELGVDDRLELRGYVAREELLRLYARCTVAAVPSRYEGFGYPAAQALCAGVPLVAARASSLPEIVGDDAPLLSPDDPGAWAALLREIIRDPAEWNRRAAAVRERAIRRFGWAASAAALRAVYEDALGGRQ